MWPDDFTIRTMTRSDLALALDWAAAEGWNPGLHDATCFHAADPDGFLIGRLGDEPVAVISVVKYGPAFGFLGLYIVKPGFRGRGFGLRLWDAGMASLAGRCVGLDGVVAQQANYRRSGFVLAHRNIRYQGMGGGTPAHDRAVVACHEVGVDALVAYDARCFAAQRRTFVPAWLAQPGTTALAVLDRGSLAGYGVLRRCRSGAKIGPLFADDAGCAERLFLALQARAVPGAPLFIDVPDVNAPAQALVRRFGLSAVFETARMYTGDAPALPIERVFGVTTLELG
jgi:ribosomal protein S18 acetylase RimI-like enzyme